MIVLMLIDAIMIILVIYIQLLYREKYKFYTGTYKGWWHSNLKEIMAKQGLKYTPLTLFQKNKIYKVG